MSVRDILQKLVPLNTLSDSGLDEVIAATQIDQTEKDMILFSEGEDDGYAVYLLQGEIVLTSENQSEPRRIRSSTDASLYAIAQLKPRQMTGTTTKQSTIARIDQNALDHIVTMDEVAGILDVRTADEYRSGAINNSLNVPLSQIRKFSESLDRTRKYVIYCQTGSRSSVAAFMLNQRGFDTVALKGGLMALTLIPQGVE